MAESAKTIEQIYQKKTQLEHILLRPDTYVGSIEHQQQHLWVHNSETQQLEWREISYVPGLYKIYDEILVNAADNFHRDKKMDTIKIDINPDQNKIRVWNNGKGIPVTIHKEQKCFVPEMIFGQLLTSSNYNDNEKKVTGGRNGYGAKLANIFSTKFVIETADSKHKKKYKQVFKNNMGVTEDPQIEPCIGEDYTCITFYPDLKRFNMTRIDEDAVALMTKRAFDLAGVSDRKVRIILNGTRINISGFEDYCDKYLKIDENKELPKIVEVKHERWNIVCSLSDGQFQQVSFVNSICTSKGGTHVNYITDQIVNRIHAAVTKKNKKLVIKAHQIKANLWIFINAQIENPAFDSQTKENLATKAAAFGSKVELTEKFLKQIMDSGVVELILSVAKAKEEAKMAKQLVGKKKSKLVGIPKLEDANDAGTRNAEQCTIILTEGDSAKSLALAGIEVVGRDKYGVFPLRGKFLNVREASNKQIMENPEIQNLIKILGIQIGKKYENVSLLRYGKIMIMTDQDHDGSHIKGLIINFLHHFWPSLLQMNGFLREFVTPILKVTKGSEQKSFFTIPEYEQWAEGRNLKGYKIKYYKGLGTSTTKEAKEYFGELDAHTIDFVYNDGADFDAIDLAFNKKKADARKEWLKTYNAQTYVDHSIKELGYKEFVNKELILFSIADCARSIPSLCDGLKPGQRKILFSCFKRKLRGEIKVAQLSGYVAEHSAYHHGEVSLQQTIVSMAQNFVASNNVNTLLPIGQFGSRLMGGKDSASARYIFTSLSPVTRTIFPEADDPVLNYLEEEGQSIEPDFYLPIIPLSLVNGAEGIGTGWSTFIPQHNPRDVVRNIKRIMNNEAYVQMHPWYKGYSGEIVEIEGKHAVTGIYDMPEDDILEITELPIGKWTRDYKNFLEELVQKEVIEDIREYHQENRVHFVLTVPKLMDIARGVGIIKTFKLQTTLASSNQVLFNSDGSIYRFKTEEDIMKEWYTLRSSLYDRRKEYQLAKLLKEYEVLRNKVRFIKAVITDEVNIKRVKRKAIAKDLKRQKYLTMSELNEIQKDEQRATVVKDDDEEEKALEDQEELEAGDVDPKEYDYLLSMPLWSLSEEKIEELTRQMQNKKHDHDELKGTHIHTLWNRDLDTFLEALSKQEEKDERDRLAHKGMVNEGKKGGKRKAVKKAAVKKDVDMVGSPRSPVAAEKKKLVKKKPTKKQSDKKVQGPPESKGKPILEELSLRERLAMKANLDANKIGNTKSTFDDEGYGGLGSLTALIGKKQPRKDSEEYQGEYSFDAADMPKNVSQQRVNAPTRNRRKIIAESDSSEFSDEDE